MGRGHPTHATVRRPQPNCRWKRRGGEHIGSGDINPACRGCANLSGVQSSCCRDAHFAAIMKRLCCKACESILATAPFIDPQLFCNTWAGLTGCKAHPSKLPEKRGVVLQRNTISTSALTVSFICTFVTNSSLSSCTTSTEPPPLLLSVNYIIDILKKKTSLWAKCFS